MSSQKVSGPLFLQMYFPAPPPPGAPGAHVTVTETHTGSAVPGCWSLFVSYSGELVSVSDLPLPRSCHRGA